MVDSVARPRLDRARRETLKAVLDADRRANAWRHEDLDRHICAILRAASRRRRALREAA